MTYTLTAELDGKIEATPIEAPDNTSAMFEAIFKILNRAHENPKGAWAKGEIKLTDEAGNLVQSMEAN